MVSGLMVNGSFGRGMYEDDSRPVIENNAGNGTDALLVDFSTPDALPFRLDEYGRPIDEAGTDESASGRTALGRSRSEEATK
ncbi:hypothetical protein [Bifidobacterium vansinderenii]|uniref:Uncharacterized protein n=1 Tax=Bifidobacterium vansinderenii TaxID=1984871 RepID=A0A229VXY5_9BIFI|nr:hypothetical protein [Bifidobacterium vansinderenii]OXN00406.1 hypothetical protein Tam10B_1276 [Bifidobacterium vansinderenii]